MAYPYYPGVYGGGYPAAQPMQPVQPMQPLPAAQPMQPIQAMTAQQNGAIRGRPVTSEEEARAIPVEFDGSVMVFPDAGHGMVYTKQLNMLDGTAIFRRYARVQEAEPAMQNAAGPVQKEYAERRELDELRQTVAQLQAAVNAIPRGNDGKKEE